MEDVEKRRFALIQIYETKMLYCRVIKQNCIKYFNLLMFSLKSMYVSNVHHMIVSIVIVF